MIRLTQAAKLGAFLVATAGAALLVYRTVDKTAGHGSGYVVHAYLRDATGIAKHSRVTIAGIPAGYIENIRLERGMARIDIRVNRDVVLFQSAQLGVKSTSLLGENTVTLTEGLGEPRKSNGDEIDVLPQAASVEDIKAQIATIATQLAKVTEQLASSVGTEQGGRNMNRILQNLADATEAVNLSVHENRAVVRDALGNIDRITAQSGPEIEQILKNVHAITGDVKALMATQNADGSPPGELRQSVERIARASKSLESTLAHIDSIAGRIDRGEGTMGKLTKDDDLANEVSGVAEGVGDYVDSLRRLQAVVGLRSDYNVLASTVKSYVELRLQPREDKYYVIELINDPRGMTHVTQTDVATTNPNDPPNYRTVTTTTTDAFRFSIQFAKRLGPMTGRFGIKESTGGIGLDTHLLSNRLEISQDLFGFAQDPRPRYRLWMGYEFMPHLWMLGGVDHLLLGDRRDYFLGLQLRFTDEDLKTILPFTGGGMASTSR